MNTYKILVLSNRLAFDFKDEMIEAVKYYAPRLPIKIEFTLKKVDIPVATKEYKKIQGFNPNTGEKGTIGLHGLVDSVKDAIREQVKQSEYHCVMFAWNRDEIKLADWTQITSWCTFNPLYLGTEYVQLAFNQYLKDNKKIFLALIHEIAHTFPYRLSRLGINARDEMDDTLVNGKIIPFYKNDDPYATDGNFAHTIANIKPYADRLCEMPSIGVPEVTLTRFSDNGTETLGDLVAPNFACKTLERAWKNNEKFVSCIPVGRYYCKQRYSIKFMRNVYELQKVPNRDGILIHGANFWFQLNGCIAPGTGFTDINSDKQTDVVNSNLTLERLHTAMKNEPFFINIRNK